LKKRKDSGQRGRGGDESSRENEGDGKGAIHELAGRKLFKVKGKGVCAPKP